MSTGQERQRRAQASLAGLALGDAYGARCYMGVLRHDRPPGDLNAALPRGPWRWTDDTAQAIEVTASLAEHDALVQDDLAARLLRRYQQDPTRGYGRGVRALFDRMTRGQHWLDASHEIFDGGSFGNGAAMRVAPLGAYLADEPLETVAEAARRSAEITHAHPEAQAGAIAVAVAAAVVWRTRAVSRDEARVSLWLAAQAHTPESVVLEGIRRAAALPPKTPFVEVVMALGNGERVSAMDTVPLCIWSAARHLRAYQEALWRTAGAGGDHDTTCAIVGGILASDMRPLPETWLARQEPLPTHTPGADAHEQT